MRAPLGTPALVAAAACAGGAALRIALAHAAALWGDEVHSLALWRRGPGEILATYDAFGSGLALPLLQHAAGELFGWTLGSLRLPAVAGGIAGLALAYPVGKRLAGPRAAALATVGLALSPVHLFYSHFARSYALVVVLALVLADGLARLLERPGSRLGLAEVATASALLPFVHLASAAAVGAGALGAGIAAAWGSRGALRPLGAALALGTVVCMILYVPARLPLLEFVRAKASGGARVPFAALDVAALYAGSRAGGALLLAALPLSAIAWLRARGAAGAPLVALTIVPAAAVAVVDPTSNAVAFARYLVGSLPFALLLLAWAALRGGERLAGERGARAAALVAAGLLAISAWRPLAQAVAVRDGPFANTYLGLHPIRAFDAALPSEADFYRRLAERPEVAEVVEVPPVRFAGALLQRGYAREHRKPVRLGQPDARTAEGAGPYLRVEDVAKGCDGVRLVVVHRNLENEIRDYLAFVASRLEAREAPMARPLLQLPPVERPLTAEMLEALGARFGPAVYESERLLVFEVPCTRAQQPG